MRNIRIALIGGLAVVTVLWFAAEPGVWQVDGFFAFRKVSVQYSGIVAIACMSAAMLLAVRPRLPEVWFGGLDKMYRLHKWLGVSALGFSAVHWMLAVWPKWAVGLGWLQRPHHGPRPQPAGLVDRVMSALHHPAENVGEWMFYAVAVLSVLALLKRFPYRAFFKTHRVLAVTYLVLVFHALVLAAPAYWLSPVGLVLTPLLAGGAWAALVVLVWGVATRRRVRGTVAAIHAHPQMRCLSVDVAVPEGSTGHRAGQFAFVTVAADEGAHPYTIASAWGHERRLTFVIKELGDHTRTLRHTLRVGQQVIVEGPYGCFTFDDPLPHQIWIGAGIGITPFIARMKQLAALGARPHTVDLFHTTADYDEAALARLRADADAAGVRLHILHDARDGLLTGGRIRQLVPHWRQASTWFCGPPAFGEALRRDFGVLGQAVSRHFHQELFAMR